MNDSFSECGKVLVDVPQGSVVGPLLFNIFINDIFLFLQDRDLASYADDSTMYRTDKSILDVKKIS